MREYRGRKVNTEKWVVGNLAYIQEDRGTCGLIVKNHGLHIVDFKSVGQYTGLKDKNGKRIYEGDILNDQEDKPLYIEFSEEKAAFCFVDVFDPYGKEYYTVRDLHYEDLEIVGNIFENPELLIA
ncbi:YopX family protein [[Brevibacterium] frigoritolerans]|nr:YopX family protein [Peribacillus frigoritolerans]